MPWILAVYLYNNPNVQVKKIGILAQEIAEIREEFENAK